MLMMKERMTNITVVEEMEMIRMTLILIWVLVAITLDHRRVRKRFLPFSLFFLFLSCLPSSNVNFRLPTSLCFFVLFSDISICCHQKPFSTHDNKRQLQLDHFGSPASSSAPSPSSSQPSQKKRKTTDSTQHGDDDFTTSSSSSSPSQGKIPFPKRAVTVRIDWNEMKEKILNPTPLPPQGQSVHENISAVSPAPVKVTREDIPHLQIIGRLDRQAGGLFIVKLHNTLFVFDQYKCEEAFVYFQLKSTHEMKRVALQQPTPLSEQQLGGKEHWDIAMNEQYHKILLFNGFELARNTAVSPPTLSLVAISNEVPNLGTGDLVELLRIIKKVVNSNRVKSSSFMVRPPRVLQYFAEESARVAQQQLSPTMTATEAKDMFTKLTTSQQYFEQCPHKHPIFTKL